MVKNLPANAVYARDAGSIPGWGRSPGGGNGALLQYSCLENPMDRGAWQATSMESQESATTEQLGTDIMEGSHGASLQSGLVMMPGGS